jgi:predicted DNA-binding transcriptional regulator YafY
MGLLPANPRESLLPLELEEALELRKPVMMEYLDAREARTHRVIEPRFIRRVSGELMLVAHCQLRQAQRTFKLERIVQLTRIEEGTPIPVEPQPQVERVNVEQVEVVTPPQVETIVEEAMVAPLEPEIISPDANRCADPAPAEFLHSDASSDLPSS